MVHAIDRLFPSDNWRSKVPALALLAMTLGSCAPGSGDAHHEAIAQTAQHEDVSQDITIPRVPNPPLASDIVSLPGDLHAAPVPGPANLADFIVDRTAAIALGKALFWDMQVGSDGIQACASCHFRAGAD